MKPFRSKISRLLSGAAAVTIVGLFPSSLFAGNHVWSGAGANANFSTAQNWSSGGVPAAREASVVLVFPAGAAKKAPIQNIADLGIDQMVIQGDGYLFSASGSNSYFLRGGSAVDIENNSSVGTVFNAPVVLNAGEIVLHGMKGDVLFGDAMSGAGGLRIDGPTVQLGGTNPNTYAGVTTLHDGVLKLSKSPGATAIPANLVIGRAADASLFPLEDVVLINSQQIANTASVTVHPTGRLLLDNNSDSIASLDMTGGSVVTGLGNLTLLGNAHCSAPEASLATISGVLSLGAQSRVFDVDAGAHLRVAAVMIGNPGIGFLKKGEGKLEITGANTYSGLTSVEAGSLVASGADVTFGSQTTGTVVAEGAQLILDWANIGNEPLQLNGDAAGSSVSTWTSYGSSSWAGPVVLNGVKTNSIHVKTVALTLSGVVSGPGSLRSLCEPVNGVYAKLILAGSAANTFTGGLSVELGKVQLNKTPGVTAVPGPLSIGHDTPGVPIGDASVEWLASNQLSDAAILSTRPTGQAALGAFSDSVGSLDMDGGSVSSAAGTLTLLGDVTSHGDTSKNHNANILGHLSLGSQTRTFNCLSGSSLYISAAIAGSGSAGITKKGQGGVGLGGANTYPGLTTILEGAVSADSNGAFGSTASGTIVASNAAIILQGVDIPAEPLEMNGGKFSGVLMGYGSTSWAGPITLNDGVEQSFYPRLGDMVLSGPIMGGGKFRLVTEKAKLIMSGNTANTYTGGTLIYSGELVLAKDSGVTAVPGELSIGLNSSPAFPCSVILSNLNQIADTSAVTVFPQGTLKLNNHTETIGSLAGGGEVVTDFATLVTGGNGFTTTFSGWISGFGFTPLIKEGAGTMVLTGTNAVAGRTLVNAGKYLVHGQSVGPVWVSGAATLGGNGSVGNVASTNGVVSPGAGPGMLTTDNLALDAMSIFRVELNGTAAGVSHDQLNVRGKVALGTSALQVTLGFVPAGNDQFVIIKNDGNDFIEGTFAGLPEGKEFQINGQKLRISYAGGTGNDVVISRVNTGPGLTSISNTQIINEGGTVDINGVINDPDAGDSFDFVVSWGDGSAPQKFHFAPGTFSFHIDHTYADDKPGAFASDSFEISYTLSDNTGPGAFGNLNVVVGNVAPVVTLGADLGVPSGAVAHAEGSFTDPGADTWTATVNYGDGSPAQPLTIGPGKTLAFDHTFPADGSYTVTVTVNDDDTGVGSTSMKVDVGLVLHLEMWGATEVRLSWPLTFKGYALQSASQVAPEADWSTVGAKPGQENGEWVQILPRTVTSDFFRLVKP